MRNHPFVDRIIEALRNVAYGPAVLAFVPATSLGAFWLGGERALVAVALGLPMMIAGIAAMAPNPADRKRQQGGLLPNDQFETVLAEVLSDSRRSGETSACFAVIWTTICKCSICMAKQQQTMWHCNSALVSCP